MVVIRPDVPGVRCYPNDERVVWSDADRAALDVALADLAQEVRDRNGAPPAWAKEWT